MALSLKESQTLNELATCLYSFLPGKPHPYADQSLSFPGVATKLALQQYWTGGSKQQAIASFLARVLEYERKEFCRLILTVVQQGMVYRKSKNDVTREEIDEINKLVRLVGFKIPDLHDPEFLRFVPARKARRSEQSDSVDTARLVQLTNDLLQLQAMEPVPRGFAFEKFLGELLDIFQLAPRGSFRMVGEQIDGSFVLDADTYLLEARWRNEPAIGSDLMFFSGKVERKAQWSRGVFISYAGFSDDGLTAFGNGKSVNLVGVDGLDLFHVISGKLDFREVLRRKIRRAAETNRMFVPVRELFVGIT